MKLKYQRIRRYCGYLVSMIKLLWYTWIAVALFMIQSYLFDANTHTYSLNYHVERISYWMGFKNNGN